MPRYALLGLIGVAICAWSFGISVGTIITGDDMGIAFKLITVAGVLLVFTASIDRWLRS